MTGRAIIWLGLAVGLLGGCSEPPPYPLPDRSTPAVQAEEQRLAALLPTELLGGPGTCRVRLLGQEGSTSFAWAHCEGTGGPGLASGVSEPVRVDGDRVTQPLDGAENGPSVRRMFPERLAAAVLDDPERMMP
ncbi:hypothetical protein V6V47_03085 [Micromonospora sp. CPCC 205539]|uniref:hypothetical protein n=1 Tax=Micromonospora sp. CPCC 205539 TaxID=3122408 RepID=UPI002FEEC57A